MTEPTQKNEEIEKRIKTHRAMIESLEAQLKENKSKAPYGSIKKAWLSAMKACTAPIANYNKNINAYLADPEVYQLEKDMNKLQDVIVKIYSNFEKLTNQKTTIKFLLKISKLEEKILTNPGYISQRYDKNLTVTETLEEALIVKTVLSDILNKINNQTSTEPGITNELQDELEKVVNPG